MLGTQGMELPTQIKSYNAAFAFKDATVVMNLGEIRGRDRKFLRMRHLIKDLCLCCIIFEVKGVRSMNRQL